MKYYTLEPEVGGEFGENTTWEDPSARPLNIFKFHYEFDVWGGDSIVEAVGCYIITEVLKEEIITLSPPATGMTFGSVEISKSNIFKELTPHKELPPFVWLQVTGKPGKDDFGLFECRLVVSQRILDLLEKTGISNCDIIEYL